MASEETRITIRLNSEESGAPVRLLVDLDHLAGSPAGWIDPDSWTLRHAGAVLPFLAEPDTLDGRRYTLRFRAPLAGETEVEAVGILRRGYRGAPSAPPDRPIPLVGAGEALRLGSTATVGDLHVGLQTAVETVDWYGSGRRDLLVTCHAHGGGAFLYAAVDDADSAPGRRPIFRLQGRLPGFGDDGQTYNGRLRAVDFRGDGRFDLLECRRNGIWWRQNTGAVGAPSFAAPVQLLAGGEPFASSAPVQSLCPVTLDGTGRVSLIIGTSDWSDYWPKDVGAWENKPGYRPYEADGSWRGGPLHGRLYLLSNRTEAADQGAMPEFAAPLLLRHEDGSPLEVYGLAGPAVIPAADPGAGFDLLVSDFLDRVWYFRNTGRSGPDGAPRFFPRTPVRCRGGAPDRLDQLPGAPPAPPDDYPPMERLPDELVLPTCMHALTVVDWSGSEIHGQREVGALDLLVGAEDGYVRALRWVGRTAEGVPIVEQPARLQEYGAHLSVGAKACPNVVDWDGDGRTELIIGNAAGQVLLARTSETMGEPSFLPPVPFVAGDRPLWLMAGTPGSIQGPSEVKWGYVNPAAGRWPATDGRETAAIVCGDALGHNTLYLQAMGANGAALVSRGRRLHVLRDGRWQPLVTRWRCRPQLVDWGSGKIEYLQVDEAGRLARYRLLPDGPDAEDGTPRLTPLGPLTYADGTPVQLDADTGGRVGRIKLAVADWDGDGLLDVLAGSSSSHPPGVNTLGRATVWLLRNVGRPGAPLLASPALLPLEQGEPGHFGSHSCVPAPCSFDEVGKTTGDRRPDLLVGSENGRIYAYRRAYIEAKAHVLQHYLDGMQATSDTPPTPKGAG